jgi:hypothetical protein
MNWVAFADGFAGRVDELVRGQYPGVRITEPDSGFYRWIEHDSGLATIQVQTSERKVVVGFIPSSPKSTISKPQMLFAYADASLQPIADAICDWIKTRHKELVNIIVVDERT